MGLLYLGEPIRKGDPLVTGKRPKLPRGRRDLTHAAGGQGDDHDGYEDIGGCIALRCVVKDLDKRVSGWGVDNFG